MSRCRWAVNVAKVAVCVASGVAVGQAGRGALTGTVTDSRGAVLQGARVAVMPGGLTAVTDAQGQYTLTGLEPGSYSLAVSYAGFEAETLREKVEAGETERQTTVLQVAGNRQQVTVYAARQGGELEAINRTLNADNIINVLPADVITSLPNANIADAIGRLPSVSLERDEGEGKYVQVRGTEPRLTNTTLDGVNIASAETVRQVKLDLIPADLVESVQINKTLQSNMEGDGIGGSVDLRTRSAVDRPTVALESTGGYTPILGGRDAYQFDGTLGKRFFEGKKLGLLMGGSYDWNGRGINDVEPAPVVLGGYDVRDYRYYRERMGFAGTADYRFSDTSSVYLKGLYSLFHNYGDRWDYNLSTTYMANGQPDGSGSVSFGAEVRRPIQDVGSLILGGHHLLGRALVNWDVDSSVGRTRDAGYRDASFNPGPNSNLNNIQFTLDNSKPLTPRLTAPGGVNIFDASQYFYAGQRVNRYYNPEVDLGFGASVATGYSVGGHASTLEIGGRFRNAHKFANQDTTYYVPTAAAADDPSLSMTKFLNTFNDSSYYGGTYKFGPAVDYEKVSAFAGQTIDTTRGAKGNNFNLLEKVSAGYVMNSVNLGSFRIVAGLRVEATNENDRGTTQDALSKLVTRHGSYIDVLPSASVRYGFAPGKGVRLVYGRGLSRPNFSDLVSFASISPGGVRTTSSVGNPNLKAEHADNVDLLYEQNVSHQGLLQAGMFYKHLSDPILPAQTTLADGTIQTQPQNVGSAYVVGFEAGFQQRFTYLPGLLNGLGVSANYAYTTSKVSGLSVLGRSDSPALLRQAPHTWNVSPTYDKRRLSARLGLTYNAANIFAYNYSDANAGPLAFTGGTASGGNTATGGGVQGPNGDLYLYAHLQVDLQGSYRLGRGFTAVAYGLNLNNEVFGFYQGSGIYPIQREFYKTTVGGGLRWSPRHER